MYAHNSSSPSLISLTAIQVTWDDQLGLAISTLGSHEWLKKLPALNKALQRT
jgi:hypothetical protein